MRNASVPPALVFAGVCAAVAGFATSAAAQARSSADTETFITYTYHDPTAGLDAFSLLIPKGWRVQGSIGWSDDPALPASSRFRFYDPAGASELNIFPTQSYFWTDNRTFLATNPPGSLRFGTRVAKPVDIESAFRRTILPKLRDELGRWRPTAREDVPELARLAKGMPTPGVEARAQAGKMRIEYRDRGKPMEEEIYAVVTQFITRQPASVLSPAYFINYWYIDFIFSFRAEKGKLDEQSKLFQAMIYSFKVSPAFFAKVVNTKDMLAQLAIRRIHATGRIGEIVAQAGSALRADQQQAWEQRQEVQERIARSFGDYIRGVDRFHDPLAGKQVELPSGYGYAWSNNLGEYIVTDSPGYNPNIGSAHHWEPLRKTR
jgi:hypothetical protein